MAKPQCCVGSNATLSIDNARDPIVIDEQVEIAIGIVFIPCCRTKQKKRGCTECLNGISVAFEFGDRLSPIHVLNNTNNLYVMAIDCSLARIMCASLYIRALPILARLERYEQIAVEATASISHIRNRY